MVSVVDVQVGVQRAAVDDDRYDDTSSARICSIRSETSSRPLRPAPAPRSARRGPPRCASMASRVNAEIVMPRRSASCRRRALRPSGSFTVVLCMGMPAYPCPGPLSRYASPLACHALRRLEVRPSVTAAPYLVHPAGASLPASSVRSACSRRSDAIEACSASTFSLRRRLAALGARALPPRRGPCAPPPG